MDAKTVSAKFHKGAKMKGDSQRVAFLLRRPYVHNRSGLFSDFLPLGLYAASGFVPLPAFASNPHRGFYLHPHL